jgi:hypothetical protein
MAPLGVIWIVPLGSACLYHNKRLRGHLTLFFGTQFLRQCVSIAFQRERKIVLAGDACSRPLITIRSHDLHVGNIKRAMGEIVSYHERG